MKQTITHPADVLLEIEYRLELLEKAGKSKTIEYVYWATEFDRLNALLTHKSSHN